MNRNSLPRPGGRAETVEVLSSVAGVVALLAMATLALLRPRQHAGESGGPALLPPREPVAYSPPASRGLLAAEVVRPAPVAEPLPEPLTSSLPPGWFAREVVLAGLLGVVALAGLVTGIVSAGM